MPKKNGITKTFSFDRDVVAMLDDVCKAEHRTQTNLIELLIMERYSVAKERVIANGKKKESR